LQGDEKDMRCSYCLEFGKITAVVFKGMGLKKLDRIETQICPKCGGSGEVKSSEVK